MSVKKNFLYNAAYQVLTLALPFATAPYVSRVLGSDGVGRYSYAHSIAYYFVILAMLGVNNYGNRAVARTRGNREFLSKTFWSIWLLQALLATILSAVYIVYALLFAIDVAPALSMLPYVISAGLDVNWFFFGLEKFKVTVTRNMVVRLTSFALMFLVVRGEDAVLRYCLLITCSNLASVIVLWPFLRGEIDFVHVSSRDVIANLKPNLILFLPVVAVSLYTVLDKVMLGSMSGMSETGVFENSFKVGSLPFAFISALGTVMLPHASNLHATGKSSEAVSAMAPSMWFAMLLSSAFSIGLVAITPEFVPVFFGSGFKGCLVAMPLIVAEMPFMAWANVIRTQLLIPTGRDREYVVSVFVGAFVNILVNVILIPRLGAVGASFGTLSAEAAVCLVQTWVVRHDLPLVHWFVEAVPGFVIGTAMYVIVRLCAPMLPSGIIGLILEILVGAISFTCISLAFYIPTRSPYALMLLDRLARMRGHTE